MSVWARENKSEFSASATQTLHVRQRMAKWCMNLSGWVGWGKLSLKLTRNWTAEIFCFLFCSTHIYFSLFGVVAISLWLRACRYRLSSLWVEMRKWKINVEECLENYFLDECVREESPLFEITLASNISLKWWIFQEKTHKISIIPSTVRKM